MVKSEKIKVAVRVRPFLAKEIGKESVCYVSKNVSYQINLNSYIIIFINMKIISLGKTNKSIRYDSYRRGKLR